MALGLRAWRRAKDISQSDMADKLGIHVNTYQNWEKKPECISISNALRIAKILDVSINDISFAHED